MSFGGHDKERKKCAEMTTWCSGFKTLAVDLLSALVRILAYTFYCNVLIAKH